MGENKRLASAYVFSSELLPTLRRVLEAVGQLKDLIGPIANFHIVVDANILIADILWLQTKRNNLQAKTALQECISAGTIIAYITPIVVREVEEKLLLKAAKCGLRSDELIEKWNDYKKDLHIREPESDNVTKYIGGQDPDDAPTLALADLINACGIFSRDSDIKAMGGKIIPIEFILQARDYSRKSAVSVSLQMGGYFLVFVTIESLQVLIHFLQKSGKLFYELPTYLKIFLVFSFILLVIYPTSRNLMISYIKTTRIKLFNVSPQILQYVVDFMRVIEENQMLPPTLP